MLKWLNFCPYISCQKAGLHNWELLQIDRISLFYLSSELYCTLSASFSANLKEWTEGLSAQLGCKQKREAACACIQLPCSYSSTFLITFLLNLLLKTPQKILFVSFLGKLIKIFWLLFFSLHAKPWNFRMLEVIITCMHITEPLLNKVARNCSLLTGYRKHESMYHILTYQILSQ